MERKTALVAGDLALLRWLTAALLFATMALTFVDVTGRYAFNAPIYGATEVIQALLAATVFSGLALVSDKDSHIAVDLFDAPLARWFGRARRIAIGVVSAAGLGLIAYELGRNALDALALGRRTVVLEYSVAWLSLPGAALCLVAAALQLNRTVRGA